MYFLYFYYKVQLKILDKLGISELFLHFLSAPCVPHLELKRPESPKQRTGTVEAGAKARAPLVSGQRLEKHSLQDRKRSGDSCSIPPKHLRKNVALPPPRPAKVEWGD